MMDDFLRFRGTMTRLLTGAAVLDAADPLHVETSQMVLLARLVAPHRQMVPFARYQCAVHRLDVRASHHCKTKQYAK